MSEFEYGMADFQAVAAGAAVLASGGGSYQDALAILQQLTDSGWHGTVTVQAYDGATNGCVLAIMGSPDAADSLTLANVANASDDLATYFNATTGRSTGKTVSVIRVSTAAQLYQAAGVLASFAGLSRNIGYAGALAPSA
jgi:hypothetical protein